MSFSEENKQRIDKRMTQDRKKILALFIAFSFVLSTVSVFAFNVYQVEIDENIPLEDGGVNRVLVKVKWNPDLEPIKFNHDAVIAELKAEAAATQEPILTYLSQKRDAEVLNTFWLANWILVEAESTTIREMATFKGVAKVLAVFNVTIAANEMEPAGDFEVAEASAEIASAEATWNIEKVRAPGVWEELGITGEGIRFATSDTGIHLEHPDLVGTLYSDDYTDPTYPGGWIEFDSAGNIVQGSVPHDTHGHGTATYGLVVGDAAGPYGAVGMAPGATGLGMHALDLPGGSGTAPQVIAALQWIIDPFDQYGNPAGEWARVSSHSWGWTDGYISEMIEPINNMYYAGHFVVAGMGNEYEGSCRSPADVYRCVGAGATDINDYVPSWSSGCVYDWPESWPEPYIKPDVSAPGDFPIIPFPPDQWVNNWYGTSFSSPEVAGAAVLMLSGNPSLTPDEIKETLQETAVWYDYYYPERPDTRYGWGRIDAYEAVMMVALPQGIRGTVTDAVTGEPLSQVKVYAEPADRSVFTDESGYYDMRLLPGTYNVTFSRFGYYEQTVYNVVVQADVFTWLDKELEPMPPGYVEGHVYFLPTMIGIPGATVEVLDIPITIQAVTDATGYYSLVLPAGTYDLEASAYKFSTDLEEGAVVSEGSTTTVDFYLEQPAGIAVVGDYESKITDFLTDEGYTVDEYTNIPAILPYVTEYGCIIVNYPGYTYYDELMDFIDATDANGIGVLWLDSWRSNMGGYWLWSYLGWPPSRYTYYYYMIEHTYYRVIQADGEIIPPEWGPGYKIIHDQGVYTDHDHAYYRGVVDGYKPGIGTVKVLTNAGYRLYGTDYDYSDSQGIIKVTRDAGNKWVVLSMHGNTPWTYLDYWHDDTKTVFLNSINWATKAHIGIPKFVVFDLDVEPEVTMWKYPVTVSVGIKNVGWITGTDTVEMYIGNILEGSTDVTLAPGEHTYLSWPNIYRFNVGTYTVKVRHLTTKFRVRPPIIELQAYEFCTDQPLECADVYGYYRKYTGPGWYEQWSYTYGGYGHSQHAQPIGDIDEDGINEIIVGGYEVPGYGMARILSYNAGLGTYIEEYNWYVPGGTYHSPSGSTVLDLDEDGDNEFVVSWTYSDADGIYAYDWDGSTLDELDYYPCGFVFDVYSCDYDEDGDVEVLIANAPWGGTPWHVIAFRWENGEFVPEAYWLLDDYTYMECPMIWSGDVDGDGHIEVVACVSDSYYSTAGTWALNWNSGTGEWEEELVYADLIGEGTHYGVTVGDVNGNGIDEIGIGNNYIDNSIKGAACLVEWDGAIYQKVWEGSWPTESPVIEALAIGDVDCDGENEFCAGGGNVHIIGWTGTAYAEESTITETMGLLAGVVIGDMDNDGLNELKACDIIGLGPGKEWIMKYAKEPTPLLGWDFEYFGHTDENGMLVFEAPASVVDMYLFVYKPEFSEKGYQYLLEKDLYIDNDIEIIYEPHPETEALVISELEEGSLDDFSHIGMTWLWKLDVPVIWPFPSWYKDPTNIVVSPAWYSFMHELYEVDAWGTWRYEMMNPEDNWGYLPPDTTYEYDFVGPISGYIEHTDNTDGTVTVEWDVTDSCGHHITGVSLDEVGLFAESVSLSMSYEPVDFDEYEALLASIIEYKPLVTLYDEDNNVIKSGHVEWDQKTITTDCSTVAYVTLRFKAGPYGDPKPEEIAWWVSNKP